MSNRILAFKKGMRSTMQLHPMIIHFPIVLLLVGVISLWISFWGSDFYRRLANYSLVGGFVFLIAAVISGFNSVDYAVKTFTNVSETITKHQMFGIVTLIIFALTLLIQYSSIKKKNPSTFLRGILFVLSFTGLVMLIMTGHFGGQLVYP